VTRHLPIEQHAQSRRRPPSTSTLTAELATVLVGVPETAWRPAVNADGSDERDGTEVTEITELVDLSA
jgi:hypothetical protein